MDNYATSLVDCIAADTPGGKTIAYLYAYKISWEHHSATGFYCRAEYIETGESVGRDMYEGTAGAALRTWTALTGRRLEPWAEKDEGVSLRVLYEALDSCRHTSETHVPLLVRALEGE